MTVKALYDYDFPSKDRQENFGDDMLVNVEWAGNMLLCTPGCFRVPRAMTWTDFKTGVVDPWAGADPDYDTSAVTDWRLDGEAMSPSDDTGLADAGIVHKALITFRT